VGKALRRRFVGIWVQIYFADGILGILRMKDETKGP
jgi:hypothetical protein